MMVSRGVTISNHRDFSPDPKFLSNKMHNHISKKLCGLIA